MKYDLPLDEDISKVIYTIGRFDAEYAGDDRSLNRLLNYLNIQVQDKALKVCLEKYKDDADDGKAYDRGYVKGVHAAIKFLMDSYDLGEKLMYPDRIKTKVPRSV